MKSSQKTKKFRHQKTSIDLPEQNTWKELQNFGLASSRAENSLMNCKKVKKAERLLDKAFELLLNKMIQQN
jgi:hypothetical protein